MSLKRLSARKVTLTAQDDADGTGVAGNGTTGSAGLYYGAVSLTAGVELDMASVALSNVAGARVVVAGFFFANFVAGIDTVMRLYNGATKIAESGAIAGCAAWVLETQVSPTVGAHTYTLKLYSAGGATFHQFGPANGSYPRSAGIAAGSVKVA